MRLLGRKIALGTALAAVVASTLLILSGAENATAADIARTSCEPVPATAAAANPTLVSFEPTEPDRLIDTRDSTGGVAGPLGAGCTLVMDMSAVGPDGITAFALSVTVIAPAKGFFTAFSCDAGQPGTSSVNARPGVPTANLIVVAPDAAGMICLFSNHGGHVVIDVSGWWGAGNNRFTPIEPVRAYDTRTLTQPVKLPGGAIQDVDLAGVFVPDSAVAVYLNVAAVDPDERGFLVVYPCGTLPPLASNLNFVAGERRAAAAVVKLGDSDPASAGRVCVTGSATTHFLIDVTGYEAPQADTSPDVVLETLADTRIVDTRTADLPGVRFEQGERQVFSLRGAVDRPDDVVAAMLNVTTVQAERAAFASVFPCAPGLPATSSSNYDLGQTANLVVTSLSDDARFCVYANSSVEVIVDLVGVFRGPPDALVNRLSFVDADGDVLGLDQPFVAGVTDYTVRCSANAPADLELGLALGALAMIDGAPLPIADPSAPGLPFVLEPDVLVEFSVRRGDATEEYFVRCLPPDFPRLEVQRSGTPSPGWYLTEMSSSLNMRDPFVAVFNERGVPIWYKRMERRLIDAKLDAEGHILLGESDFGFGASPDLGRRIYDFNGELLDVQQTPDAVAFPVDHHDYVEIAAGAPGEARAMLSYPLVTGADLTNLELPTDQSSRPCPTGDVGNSEGTTVSRSNGSFVDGTIVEMATDDDASPWRWSASEHFGFNESTYALCFGRYGDQNPVLDNVGNPTGEFLGEVDPFHLNSLQRLAEAGCEPRCDYVVSARHLDAVIRIDRDSRDPDGAGPLPLSTGYVDWILGGTVDRRNLNGAPRLTIVDDPFDGPRRVHDARLDGDILTMHDNRTGTGQPARFVAYRLDTSNADPTQWTATMIRQIFSPNRQASGAFGSARLATDGSVLMGWGALQPAFVEYGPDDAELLRIGLEIGYTSYRVVKYAPETLDVTELRASAGGVLAEPPPR